MKYSDYQQNENGYVIKAHSKILNFILKVYGNKIARKFRKLHNFPEDIELYVNAEINFKIDLGEKK